MQITEIGRERLAVDVEPLESVMGEANEVLGYKLSQVRNATEAQTALRQVLAKLEIEPLIEADVVRYQAERLAEMLLSAEFIAEAIKSKSNYDYRFYHFWKNEDIENYHLPIPEFVLAKAIQIKKEMPSVKFHIQSCENDPDPFLVAEDGYHDHAYIEVWAEPKFEGRISVRG